ncbi:MAG: protein kinase [Lentisphaerales bacterium]|nr:protein kinase [Lentisphaerales bacterium]
MIIDEPIKENDRVEVFSRKLEDKSIIVIKKFKDSILYEKEVSCFKALKKIAVPIKKYSDCSFESPYYLSLEGLLKQPLSPLTAKRIAVNLLKILQILHSLEIVHADLKPSNIFLDDNKQLRLNDFETVQSKNYLPKEDLCSGTPGFSAPEVWIQSQLDWRADQYSAGIILCLLFCGQKPYTETAPEKLYEIQKNEPVNPGSLNPDLSGDINEVIKKMCSFEVNDRYESPVDILNDLENAAIHRAKHQILVDDKSVVISSQERKLPLWAILLALAGIATGALLLLSTV